MKKKVLTLMLAAVMVCTMAACGNGNAQSSASEDHKTSESTPIGSSEKETSTQDKNDGKVTYKITVVDENNTPIKNAMVQMCKDSCLPGSTGETGTAEFKLAEDTYKVSFMSLPAGYTYSTEETEFYFEDGKTEMTIVLKAAE